MSTTRRILASATAVCLMAGESQQRQQRRRWWRRGWRQCWSNRCGLRAVGVGPECGWFDHTDLHRGARCTPK